MHPLVPDNVDLRDFAFMPVDVQRLLTSETWVLGNGDERSAAMTLWLVSWHQVPAGSLPDNDRMLAHLSQAKNWSKIKTHVMRGWLLAEDGRYYHPVVAEKALEAWLEKLAQRLSSGAGNAKRWGVEFNPAPIEAEIGETRTLLANLNPQSRQLSKRRLSGIPSGSKKNPVGNPEDIPSGIPSGSQETGTGTGIKDQEQQGGSAPAEPPQPDDDESGSPTVDPVPYQAIVQAYHDRLPQLARVRLVTAQRRTSIRRAWQSLPTEHRRIGAFRAIFAECAMDDFLNGNGPYSGEHANWRPDFDHLIKLKTLTRVYEKAMDRRERLRQESPAQSTLGAAA